MMEDYYIDMMIASVFRSIMAELADKDNYKNEREKIAALMIVITCKENINLIMEKWRKILDDKTGS